MNKIAVKAYLKLVTPINQAEAIAYECDYQMGHGEGMNHFVGMDDERDQVLRDVASRFNMTPAELDRQVWEYVNEENHYFQDAATQTGMYDFF